MICLLPAQPSRLLPQVRGPTTKNITEIKAVIGVSDDNDFRLDKPYLINNNLSSQQGQQLILQIHGFEGKHIVRARFLPHVQIL